MTLLYLSVSLQVWKTVLLNQLLRSRVSCFPCLSCNPFSALLLSKSQCVCKLYGALFVTNCTLCCQVYSVDADLKMTKRTLCWTGDLKFDFLIFYIIHYYISSMFCWNYRTWFSLFECFALTLILRNNHVSFSWLKCVVRPCVSPTKVKLIKYDKRYTIFILYLFFYCNFTDASIRPFYSTYIHIITCSVLIRQVIGNSIPVLIP